MKAFLRGSVALLLCTLLILPLYFRTALAVEEEESPSSGSSALNLNAVSAVLMEYETGKILYEQNADEKLPPASITKIMTLLLVMEAVDQGKIGLDDMVTTSDTAASMGGSQIYLETGEQMCVRDMIKSVVIASANDAAAALAEHLCGSIEVFVKKMNERAAELGMQNTNFENTNGLDDTTVNHYTSARDVAIMSRALISHPLILEYSSIWMDTVRDGAFGLTNTNRLIRFYPGATGLKTGSTAKAGFCISATAMRNGMHLIAVVMGSPTRDIRNEEAKKLLDYGFANYALYHADPTDMGEARVTGGIQDSCRILAKDFSALVDIGDLAHITTQVAIPPTLAAPIGEGDKVGTVSYYVGEEKIGECDIVASETIAKISWTEIFLRILRTCFTNRT